MLSSFKTHLKTFISCLAVFIYLFLMTGCQKETTETFLEINDIRVFGECGNVNNSSSEFFVFNPGDDTIFVTFLVERIGTCFIDVGWKGNIVRSDFNRGNRFFSKRGSSTFAIKDTGLVKLFWQCSTIDTISQLCEGSIQVYRLNDITGIKMWGNQDSLFLLNESFELECGDAVNLSYYSNLTPVQQIVRIYLNNMGTCSFKVRLKDSGTVKDSLAVSGGPNSANAEFVVPADVTFDFDLACLEDNPLGIGTCKGKVIIVLQE